MQLVPAATCLLPVPPSEEKISIFLQPCMYLYDLSRVCAIGVQLLLLSQNPLLWAWPRTSAHASSTRCLMLFAPGTFLSCAVQWLYFVICSISTLQYQFTALSYSVSSKSEKWKERSYITGLVLQSQPTTSRIALQGFPPSKTSPSSPKALLSQALRQFARSILKPEHLNGRDSLHLTLRETGGIKLRYFWSIMQAATWLPSSMLFLWVCSLFLIYKTADPSVNHIKYLKLTFKLLMHENISVCCVHYFKGLQCVHWVPLTLHFEDSKLTCMEIRRVDGFL